MMVCRSAVKRYPSVRSRKAGEWTNSISLVKLKANGRNPGI
jgi:hypothetical protein